MDEEEVKDPKKEEDGKKSSHKLLAVLLGAIPTLLSVIVVILLPTLVFGFLGSILSGFSDWASLWGSSYKLEDFTHYVDGEAGTSGEYTGDVSDETYSVSAEGDSLNAPTFTEDPNGRYRLVHYPDETDFVDVAIKAEIKQLSRNIFNNLSFTDAIAPFDNVYIDLLEKLSNDFRSTYVDTGIVTNYAYAQLYDETGAFDKTSVKDSLQNKGSYTGGLVGSMWSKGQILDEYLGVDNNTSTDETSSISTNVRTLFKTKSASVHDIAVNTDVADTMVSNYYLADCLAQWMYATMKVDSNRFITDAEQAEIYGTEQPTDTPETSESQAPDESVAPTTTPTPVYREKVSNKDDAPLFYYTRKKTDGSSAGTKEDQQKGGFEDDRKAEIKIMALDMAKYLAAGVNSSTELASKIDSSLYNINMPHHAFLSYEALNPNEVEPIEYDPMKMNDLSNTVGLGTISTIYGQLEDNYQWYTVSCGDTLAVPSDDDTVPVKQKMDINTSGFYVMKYSGKETDTNGTLYELLYAGENYSPEDCANADAHYGYGSYGEAGYLAKTFNVKSGSIVSSVSDTDTLLNDLRSAIDVEFSLKLDELRDIDHNTIASTLLQAENDRRGRRIDAIHEEYGNLIEAKRMECINRVNARKQQTLDAKTAYDEAEVNVSDFTQKASEQYRYYTNLLINGLLTIGYNGTVLTSQQGDPKRYDGYNPLLKVPQYATDTIAHYVWYTDIESGHLARGENSDMVYKYFQDFYEGQYLKNGYKNKLKLTVTDSMPGLGYYNTIVDAKVVIDTYIVRYYPLKIQLEAAKANRDWYQAEWGRLATSELDEVAAIESAYAQQIADLEAERDKKKENVKKEGYTVTFQTRVAWFLGDETVTDIPDFGNGVKASYEKKFLAMLHNYSMNADVSDVYANIEPEAGIILRYGNISAGTNTNSVIAKDNKRVRVNSNTAHFVITYNDGAGNIVRAKMNHLICYRIMYSGMYNDGEETIGVIHAPATYNNRYNFSKLRTEDGTELLYAAEAKPVTNEETLQASVDMMEDIDESLSATPEPETDSEEDDDINPTESGATEKPAAGDVMITETESLKEMLTDKTWTKRDRNWRKSFYIHVPDEEWRWNE